MSSLPSGDVALTYEKVPDKESSFDHIFEGLSLSVRIAKSKGAFDIHSVVIGKLKPSKDVEAKEWRCRLTAATNGVLQAAMNPPSACTKRISNTPSGLCGLSRSE